LLVDHVRRTAELITCKTSMYVIHKESATTRERERERERNALWTLDSDVESWRGFLSAGLLCTERNDNRSK
jgi:hypothetical protein